ncbi:MAG: universal stress protein [Planctomycetota bacterium]|jgi:nucleotide-binding universal stress UspA family protein
MGSAVSTAIKRILFPTDFSDVSLAALPNALEHAERYDAEFHCVHVIDDAYQYWGALGPESIPVGPPPEAVKELAEKQMSELVDSRLANLPHPAVTEILTGRPFSEIIAYAREQEIDLIVMATHGRGALAHMLLGSTTELVVRKAPCAVLIIRWREHKFEMP